MGANASQTISLAIEDFGTGNSASKLTLTTPTSGTGPEAATDAKQISKITVATTVAAGDIFTVAVGSKSISYTVTAANVTKSGATNAGTVAAAINTALGTISGVGSAASGKTITFTAST